MRRRRELLGGKGANQAVGAAQLGARVGLLGVVGPTRSATGCWRGRAPTGSTSARCCAGRTPPTALIVDLLDAEAHWRYLEDLPEATLLTPDDVAGAADALRAPGRCWSSSSSPRPRRWPRPGPRGRPAGWWCWTARRATRRTPTTCSPLADVLRADARETELITGDAPADAEDGLAAGRKLLRRGPSLVAVEVAGVGNAFVWPDGELFLPLTDTPTVDTTGAGDAFVAALTVALLRGDAPPAAARYAVAAAGATVGHPGGRPALTPAALREQLDRLPPG